MQPYLAKLQEVFPHKTEPELELLCSASLPLQRKTGISAHTHRRRAMEQLFPNRVWHEWREDRIRSVQECLEKRTQELMWIGSSNSNKTGDAADIAITLWLTKPEMTSIYIASPFESATETGVWAEIQEQFEVAKSQFPGLPGKVRHSDNSIVLFDRNPRSFIRVTTVDQVGKLVGKKSRNAEQGLLVFILDELPAFTASATRALMSTMANLISVRNLLVIGAGNFASPWDALGQFCDPNEDDIPNGYEGFDTDRHFRWRTKRGGLCLRFDGLQSPNVKAGADIYPFLTTNEYIAKLAAAPGGLQSADAMRFIRSAPITNLDAYTMTSVERIKAGGCYDDPAWTADPVKSGAFVDPGFGGDACILQKFKFGTAIVAGEKRQIFAPWDRPFVIPIRLGIERNGKPYTPEEQIVEQSRDHCRPLGIPDDHIGFDGSMRAAIVQKFSELWSPRIKAIDSGGRPTERKVNATEKKIWRDTVDRLLSEQWFIVSMLIDSGQIRGIGVCKKAIMQMCHRRWQWSTGKGRGKKRVQTKLEYREMMVELRQPAESPNEADAIVGCVEIARGLGLMPSGLTVSGGAMSILLQMRSDRGAINVLKSMTEITATLPSGRLHGMNALKPTRTSGKLHR